MTNTSPYVHLVAEQAVPESVKAIYDQFLEKHQAVPKWVQVMANNPDILVGFYRLFKATMDDSPLPKLLKWKVAQVVSELNQCAFCVDVTHAQLKQFDLTDDQIAQLEETSDKKERAAIAYAKAATQAAYKIEPAIIDQVKQHFSDPELVELAAVVGLFNYINRFNDALNVLPE